MGEGKTGRDRAQQSDCFDNLTSYGSEKQHPTLLSSVHVPSVLQGFLGLPLVHDLTTRQYDVWIDEPATYGGVVGASGGALAALALLQATSNCTFYRDVS